MKRYGRNIREFRMNDGRNGRRASAAGIAQKHCAAFYAPLANNACLRNNPGMIATRINWNVVHPSSPFIAWMIEADTIGAAKCKIDN